VVLEAPDAAAAARRGESASHAATNSTTRLLVFGLPDPDPPLFVVFALVVVTAVVPSTGSSAAPTPPRPRPRPRPRAACPPPSPPPAATGAAPMLRPTRRDGASRCLAGLTTQPVFLSASPSGPDDVAQLARLSPAMGCLRWRDPRAAAAVMDAPRTWPTPMPRETGRHRPSPATRVTSAVLAATAYIVDACAAISAITPSAARGRNSMLTRRGKTHARSARFLFFLKTL